MGRPRAISPTDMDRALASLRKAGVPLSALEVIIEPGRVRLVPKESVELLATTTDYPKPKEWPVG